MNISNRVKSAIKVITTLSLLEEGERMSASKLVEEETTSSHIMLDVLRKLRSKGLIKSYMGTDGGYVLNRFPGEITFRDVFEAVEGEYSEDGCFLNMNIETSGCGNYPNICNIQKKFREIQSSWLRSLEEINFENIFLEGDLNPIPECIDFDSIIDFQREKES